MPTKAPTLLPIKGKRTKAVSWYVFLLSHVEPCLHAVADAVVALRGFPLRRLGGPVDRAYKPFSSTARRDGVQFNHWVPANAEFVDYPFARFNKKVRGVCGWPLSATLSVSSWIASPAAGV